MNLFRIYRNIAILTVAVYTIFHVNSTCPLSKPLPFTAESTDAICLYSHKGYAYIDPYLSFVSSKYHNSPLQPKVDVVLTKIGQLATPHLSKVHNVFIDLKNSAFQKTNVSEEELLANLESGSKVLAQHLTSAINFSIKHFNQSFYPFIIQLKNTTVSFLKYTYVRIKLFLYINWQIYVKPAYLIIRFKIENSIVGEKWNQLKSTSQFKLFSFYFNKVIQSAGNVYYVLLNKWAHFKETNEAIKMSDSFKVFEEKKNFILSEFNRIVSNVPNFNINGNILNLSKEKIEIEELLDEVITENQNNDKEEEEEDYEETETQTLTSTITITSTSQKSSSTVTPTSEKYQSLLDSTLVGAQNDFESQVVEISREYAANLRLKFTDSLRNLGNDINSDYEDIYDSINKINLIRDPTAAGYVSRQDFRDILQTKRDKFESSANSIAEGIKEYSEIYVQKVSDIRESILEALEEFADSSLTAYSAEIVSNGADWKEWKNFNKVKNELITFRDNLIGQDINKISTEFQNSINGIKTQVNILLNEGGSFLAILRAKANLEFQFREKAEAEEMELFEAEKIEQQQKEDKAHAESTVVPQDIYKNSEKNSEEEEEEATETETHTVLQIIPLQSQTASTEVVIDIGNSGENVQQVINDLNEKIQDYADTVSEVTHTVLQIIPLKSQTATPEDEAETEAETGVNHALNDLNKKIEDVIEPINEIVHPVADNIENIVDDVVEDGIKAIAYEAAYEAADVVEAVVENKLNVGEIVGEALNVASEFVGEAINA